MEANSRLAISCLLKNVLMEQFHVSRQTLREALRVSEYLSTAHFFHIHIISIYL